MASDSALFRTRSELQSRGSRLHGNKFEGPEGQYLPLVEAKMLVAFDHRYGTYEGATEAHFNKGFLPHFTDADHADPGKLVMPNEWVAAAHVDDALRGSWDRGWLLGWRDICRRTDIRTIQAVLTPRAAVGHTTPLMFPDAEPRAIAGLYANLCSFVLDYAARQKVGGTHMTYGYLKQLPVLPPDALTGCALWHNSATVTDWLLPRVLELTYTAWDLEPFASDVGYAGPPFRWDADRRLHLRSELDAAFFHLYALRRDDATYVLDTFPIVRRNDEKAHGEYRTRRVILEIYDAMSEAVRTGKPYKTRLDPPPADLRVAHQPRSGKSRALT